MHRAENIPKAIDPMIAANAPTMVSMPQKTVIASDTAVSPIRPMHSKSDAGGTHAGAVKVERSMQIAVQTHTGGHERIP